MFSPVIFVALLLTAGEAVAAPQATGTLLPLPQVCAVPDYGPFKLFAIRKDTGDTYPARLLPDDDSATSTTSHMIVSTNATCTECGITPSYWSLKSMELFAVNSVTSATTVNQQANSGSQLSFINEDTPHTPDPIYCSESTGPRTRPVLSVYGNSTTFTMCAFTSQVPAPTIWTIEYRPTGGIQPVGEKCYPVNLVMQSIGIVPY